MKEIANVELVLQLVVECIQSFVGKSLRKAVNWEIRNAYGRIIPKKKTRICWEDVT
jgi:hypothetical protein